MKSKIILFLLVLWQSAAGQKKIYDIKFEPGTSIFGNGNDGIVQVNLKTGPSDTTTDLSAVCDSNFKTMKNNVYVFCYEMGFEKGVGAKYDSTKTTKNSVKVNDVRCTVSDPSNPANLNINRCSYDTPPKIACPSGNFLALMCGKKRPAAAVTTAKPNLATVPPIDCSSSSSVVRLVDGTKTSGRVEVFHNGKWGTICNAGFTNNEAKVICKMACLNSDYAKAVTGNYPPGNGTIWLSNLNCPANANTTNDCTHRGWGNPKSWCTHKTDAQVECSPNKVVTPPAPNPDVVCSDATATILFIKTKNPDLKTDMLAILEKSSYDKAKCNFQVTENATHVYATFKFTECGGTTTFNKTATMYRNDVLRMFRPQDGLIYDTNYTVPVVCVVPKDNRGNGGNLGAKTVTVPPKVGTDKLSLELKLYKDAAMTQEIPTGTQIVIQSRIYVKVKETANFAQNQMAIRNCWATGAASRTSKPRRDLIKDACPVKVAALAVSSLTSHDAMTQSFSFKSFLFDGSTSLYVHCDTVTCHTDDANPNCRRACVNRRRRKRSVSTDPFVQTQQLFKAIDDGPYFIVVGPVGSSSIPGFSLAVAILALLVQMMLKWAVPI